jgi:UDP-3-O-[3-hydroxymyristoyl] glucosamine N-acyltransferase
VIEISAKELAALLGAHLEGQPDTKVTKLAKIEEADAQSFCFLANPKYFHFAQTANVGILLCDETLEYNAANIGAVLRVKEPYQAFQKLMELYAAMSAPKQTSGVHPHSFIGKNTNTGDNLQLGAFSSIGNNCTIGKNVTIFSNVSIGDNSNISDDCIIYSNVSIYHGTQIGKRTIIHSGAVIGSDGFGFAPQEDGTYKKIPQTGTVEVGSDVEIGANTCIDRAVIGATKIGNGVKLDNLIQVAHNVEIGDNTVIAAQAGISGSTKFGKNVMIGGQAGITGHLTIADGVKIQAQAAVIRDVPEKGKGLSGVPAIDAREHYRIIAYMQKLPDMAKRLNELEKKIS